MSLPTPRTTLRAEYVRVHPLLPGPASRNLDRPLFHLFYGPPARLNNLRLSAQNERAGRLWKGKNRCHKFLMTNQFAEAQQVATPNYRLVVNATQKAKQFVWVVVDDNHSGLTVQTSKRTFRSMDDAYNAGKGALEYWRAKMRRTTPAVDLAQPPTAKPPVQKAAGKVPTPGGSSTSSIYSGG